MSKQPLHETCDLKIPENHECFLVISNSLESFQIGQEDIQ
jgi:hypothetical protein